MEMREILVRNGFSFKKQFGQNFLTDANLLRAIVADAGVDGQTTVLEIGTGAGALTRALAERAGRVVSYEIDKTLKPVLGETLAGLENCEVVFRDFAREPLAPLEEELGDYLVVANLPYYITTPVVMKLVEGSRRCRGITVMVQEEVAERFTATAGTPAYGAVTAAIARRASCELVRRVSRELFTPRPNVDSAVVRMRFEEGRLPPCGAGMYRTVVRAAFASRRKTLENNLMGALRLPRERVRAMLQAAGIPEGVRGETLTPVQFALLAGVLERG